MTQKVVPQLVTFDGEARSGKGTIVQATKDFLRDTCGYKVMLIDRGQTFRVLVVAATRAGVNLDDPTAIDDFLSDETNITACVQFVKDVYHMDKSERDGLLYTNSVGENSAKVGARPASQKFVANLTKKWLHDAGGEGYEVVLVDGRALEHIALEMDAEDLCRYRLGLYFVCDAKVGARRTLGFAGKPYDALTSKERADVDELVAQINERNQRDRDRTVERVIPPETALTYHLPDMPLQKEVTRPMLIIDTSAEITKAAMSSPVAQYVAGCLRPE